MSDISIHFSPLELALIVLVITSPGLIVGGIGGAVAWRGRRLTGALIGAILGGALCILWVFLFGLK